MQGNHGFGEHLPDSLGAGGEQLLQIEPGLFAAEGAVGLVADLHHAHIHLGLLQLLEAIDGVRIEGLGLFLDAHAIPGLGHHLLAGVGPEIGIMEVYQ